MDKSLPIVNLVSGGTYYNIGEDWYKVNPGQILDYDDWRTMALSDHQGDGPFTHPMMVGKEYYRVGDFWLETEPGSLTLVETGSTDFVAIQAKLAEKPYKRTWDASAPWRLNEL